MIRKRNLSRNIPLSYLFVFFSNLDLTHGVWMIFLAAKGFSLLELGIMEGVFHATSILMEVPTGAVADLWGRRTSRITGRLFFLVSLLLMFFAHNFFLQVLGFSFCALSYNLESGAGEALLFDSLKSLGRRNSYMKINSRKELLLQAAWILSFLGGGCLAVRSYPRLFALSAFLCLAATGVAWFFIEPPVVESPIHDAPLKELYGETYGDSDFSGEGRSSSLREAVGGIFSSIVDRAREGVSLLKGRPVVFLLIVYTELIFTFTTILFFFLQTMWKAGGLTEWAIGLIYAFRCGLSGVTGLSAPGVEKRLGPRRILIALPFLLVFCLWGVALSPRGILFFIITGLLEGIIIIALGDYINQRIPSGIRATVLSFQSMVFSFFMILLFPLVGMIGDRVSLSAAFLLCAVIGTVLYFIFLYVFGRKKCDIPVS